MKPRRGSVALDWNRLDTNSTLAAAVASLVLVYAGPPLLGWIESWGGVWSLAVVPALYTAGHAIYRWLNDNPDLKV